MATYDYYCEANGRTLEVKHPMSESLNSWGELCRLAGIEPGKTPIDAPVSKLMSAPSVQTPKIGEWKKSTNKPHAHGPSCGCGH